MQAVQPCRLLSQGYNYEENPALDLYSIYQSRFATPCSLFDLYRRFSIFKHKQKKPYNLYGRGTKIISLTVCACF